MTTAFSGLRTFALCKSYVLSLAVLLLSLVPLGVNFVRVLTLYFLIKREADSRFGIPQQSFPIYGVNDPSSGSCGQGENLTVAERHKCATLLPPRLRFRVEERAASPRRCTVSCPLG